MDMKKIASTQYYDYKREKNITIDIFELSDAQADYYSNVDYLYNCKAYPNNFECDSAWLFENFGVENIDDAIEMVATKEFEFLQDQGLFDYFQDCGLCKEYSCTFINDRIVSVECEMYYDI